MKKTKLPFHSRARLFLMVWTLICYDSVSCISELNFNCQFSRSGRKSQHSTQHFVSCSFPDWLVFGNETENNIPLASFGHKERPGDVLDWRNIKVIVLKKADAECLIAFNNLEVQLKIYCLPRHDEMSNVVLIVNPIQRRTGTLSECGALKDLFIFFILDGCSGIHKRHREAALLYWDISQPLLAKPKIPCDGQTKCKQEQNSTAQCSCGGENSTNTVDSRPCQLERKTSTMLIRSTVYLYSFVKAQKRPSIGKRCQRLQATAWNVDVMPNPKGQAKRNSLKCPDEKLQLSILRPNSPGSKGNRSLVDVLLMSAQQRHPADRSRPRNLIVFLLVSLACMRMLLGDQAFQRTARHHKWCLRLLRPPALDLRTMEKVSKGMFYSYTRFSLTLIDGKSVDILTMDTGVRKVSELSSFQSTGPKRLPRLTTSVSGGFPGSQAFWVAPASAQFLPGVTSKGTQFLDHAGYRLASLAALPPSCTVSRVRLADAGFHFDPRTSHDSVVCHKCGLTYRVMPPTTASPLAFHHQMSPGCPFLTSVLEQFTEMPSGAAAPVHSHQPSIVQQPSLASTESTPAPFVPSSSSFVGERDEIDGRDLFEDCEGTPSNTPSASSVGEARLQPSSESRGYTLALPSCSANSSLTRASTLFSASSSGSDIKLNLSEAVYPQFSTTQSRLATFTKWPLTSSFPSDILVDLGFFYAGYADCVRCFFCGVGLKSWTEGDDVLEEHIRWRPSCAFLLATKGRQFIQDTLNRLGNASSRDDLLPASATSRTSHSSLPTVLTPRNPVSDRHAASLATSLSGNKNSDEVPDAARCRYSGSEGRTGNDAISEIRQRLVAMGFSLQDICRAEAHVRSSGEDYNIEQILSHLLPE